MLARTARRRAAVWRRALSAFHQMVPVRGRTGVLIFVSVEEGQAAVIADRGIAAKAPPDYWGGPCGTIVAGMAKGEHAEGIIRAIAAIGEELARHFPRMDDDVNELPDRPKVDE
ncbi:MAG: hypothetical protein QUT27_14340 [candidate division Zixibacteria bacterium]|nr:hypothetical protein [candidate division Zixibacteria bacterium]